jgi:hypothetical protein
LLVQSRLQLWIALVVCVVCFFTTKSVHAGDPYLEWYTLTTPRFRVTYHMGLERQAQSTATLLESVHRRLSPQLGWKPKEVTEVLLTDVTDAANGSATALPYNAVRLFVTAPDDMSPLGEYDDWLTELVTHEYTHVLHVDNISGLPALLNAVAGKTSAPNQAQPRWILEGLAVAMETQHTGGGRLRSSQFDMILRADILEGRMAHIDQISNPARRWPGGNLWYLYGGAFIGWITDVYGPQVFAAVASDYGSNIIPWGINRSIRRATGRTYLELYAGWRHHLERKYAAQIAEVNRRGLREGTRLTHRGRIASSPRFVPPCARSGEREEILYYRDDGHSVAGFYRVPLENRALAAEDDAELVTRSGGHIASYEPSCGFVFDSVAPSTRRYYFNDLFRQPRGTTSPRGLRGSRERLTTGARARDPDVSPRGDRITYATNSRGTSTLRIANLTPSGEIQNQRALVRSAHDEQAFTPRFSPDGKKVAYSAWTAGGHRDIRVVDVKTRRFFEVTHDVAMDQQPTWSPDGKTLYFTSDRSGIPNVYAYDLADQKLHQVTNVKTGAYMPELSSDGATLFYIGYTSDGFDLYSMPIQRSRWLDPPPPPGPRTSPHPKPPPQRWPIERYDPLATLRPRAYEVEIGRGTFGNTIRVATSGSDIAGHHAFSAAILAPYESEDSIPSASISYAYRRLPFDFFLSAFRSAAPRRGYRYGDQEPRFVETFTGVTTGVSFGDPGEFDSQSMTLTYTAGEFDSKLPVGTRADPYSQVTVDPHRGFLGIVGLGYGYSNADSTVYGLGPERGFTAAANMDFAARETGSDDTLTSITARVTGYVPMPWLDHHVLALAASGGAAVGSYPRRGYFYTGGFVEQTEPNWRSPWDIVDAYDNGTRAGAFLLRGYEPTQFIGTQFNLINAEYRFPILYPDRGVLTLPVFLRSISGVAFADYGGAFNQLDLDDPLESYHLGVGGELWFDLVLGYHVRGIIRFGHARGIDDEAPDGGQTYLVVGSVF